MPTAAAEPEDSEDSALSPPIEPTTYHRRLLLDNVPPNFLRDFVRALLWAYRLADEKSREMYDEPEAHDSIGDIRRGLIEGALRAQAQRHGGSGRALRNEPGTAFFSRAQFGQLRLTECAVNKPGILRRPADFRAEMAAESQTAFSFKKKTDADETLSDFFYAIVYHGHYVESRKKDDFNIREPDFLGILFPNEDCTAALAMIDLTAQLRYEIESAKTADVEQVGDLDLGFTAKTGTKIDDKEGTG